MRCVIIEQKKKNMTKYFQNPNELPKRKIIEYNFANRINNESYASILHKKYAIQHAKKLE